MSCYMIFIEDGITDQSEIDEYKKLVPATSVGSNMKKLAAYGNIETLEGSEALGTVLLEFPTRQDAIDWYDSEEYKKVRIHRQKGADYRVILFESI